MLLTLVTVLWTRIYTDGSVGLVLFVTRTDRGTGCCFESISLSIYFFVCFFVSKITRKRLDQFIWNFQGRCGVTMGRPDSIFGQFGKPCDATMLISLSAFVNITNKRLDWFAWNFQWRRGLTMGQPDYIFSQFQETVQYRNAQHGGGVCCTFAPQLVIGGGWYCSCCCY